MVRRTAQVVIVLVTTFGLATTALAHPPDDTGSSPGHSDTAPGIPVNGNERTVAEVQCRATWGGTPLAGDTGNLEDNKQGGSLDPGVSNCDQWWNWAGNGQNNMDGNKP